ncbi:hypothetical protein [Mesorhizobium sp. M0965]|uniref:hypothetical protein n=1 Tax=Mesorhizobium sp. M0965 TaxID=2957036 RepID=UPI0033357D17
MAQIDVRDANGFAVPIEKPLSPGRAAAASSRPVVLSNEDAAALAQLHEDLATTLAGFLDGLEALIGTTNAGNAAILAKLSADPATQTTLAALLAKVIAAPATEAKQDAGNTALDSILAKIVAAPATEAKQDAANVLLAAATPAGENHIGSVGGNTSYIDVTLSLDTAIYSSGDVLADTQIIANAMRVNNGTGVLQSITVIDQDDQRAALNIFLLSANVSMGVENAAPSITDVNATELLGPPIAIAIADYFDLGGVSMAGKDGIGKVVKPAAGTRDLYIAVVNGPGSPTYTAAGIKLRLGFLQD